MKNIAFHWLLIIAGVTIFTFNTNAQKIITYPSNNSVPEFYYDNEEIKNSVAKIAELIDNGVTVYRIRAKPVESYHTWGSEKNVKVLEDRIELTKDNESTSVPFKLIIKDLKYGEFYGRISIYFADFEILIKGKEAGQNVKNEFELLLEKNNNVHYENRKKQLAEFEKSAAEYRALKVKPPVSEEQRRFIVQANAFNEKKMYDDAIRLYEQAIVMDQTGYPSAYSNLALLSAQVKKYDDAIYNMKKYLLLVPDASDARGARDMIYEWEALITK